MPSAGVVEALDVVEDISAGFVAGAVNQQQVTRRNRLDRSTAA
jgi:hypothetical protein